MLLIPEIPKGTVLEIEQPFVWGRLQAVGEPRRRIWKAQIHWTTRRGAIRGTMNFECRWLSSLLRQVLTVEQKLVAPYVGKPLQDLEWNQHHPFCLELYYEHTLRQSVNNTAKRWCKDSLPTMEWKK